MSRDDKARRELYPLISEAIEKGYADLGCGFDISVAQAITPNMYNALMREGYRKASEVAREIFEEIETSLHYKLINGEIHFVIREEDYNHYKKKYLGEDTNVTTKESENDNGWPKHIIGKSS